MQSLPTLITIPNIQSTESNLSPLYIIFFLVKGVNFGSFFNLIVPYIVRSVTVN